ncbi:MAG: hypothetical protein JWQ09_5392 [Segetibacter sp.]|nr:hypothetical protein [Segetibacter sp.]
MKFSTIILIIACIAWGILIGGVVYSHLVFFPVYLSDLPKSAEVVNGTYGMDEAIFWIIIHPILILSLIVAMIANRKYKERRNLILISFAVYAIILIISGIYFVPELMKFKSSPTSGIPASEWIKRGRNWMTYSVIRAAVILVVTFPLFMALTKPATPKQIYPG